MTQLHIESFYHKDSQTYSHLVVDLNTSIAAVVDPVMDYDPNTGKVSHVFSQQLLSLLNDHKWQLKWVLETHVHADHLTAAQFFKQNTGAQVVIAKTVKSVQQHFDHRFDLHSEQEELFELLVSDGDSLPLGQFDIRIMATPGHTQACITFVIEEGDQLHAFIGDTLFMPDIGSARCDFPGGDAASLFASIQRLYALPDHGILYLCHDYPPPSREPVPNVTVQQQKAQNIHCQANTSLESFVAVRTSRDASLAAPRLILPSLQVNIRAGHLPVADSQGRVFMKTPVSVS